MTQRAHFSPRVGRRDRDTLADGSYWAYSYNDRSEVTGGEKHLPPAQAEAVARGHAFGYGYDPIGNRKQSTVNGRTAAYTANALNQYAQRAVPPAVDVLGSAAPEAVVQVTGPQGTQTAWRQGTQFSLAVPVDNAAAAQFPAVSISAKRSTVAGGGAVTETTSPPTPLNGKLFLAKNPEVYAYDFDGNTLSDGRWDYTWDGENRLKSAETRAGAVAAGVPRVRVEYAYDGRGRRIARTVRSAWNGTAYAQAETRRFLYDAGWNVLAEIDTPISGSVTVKRLCLWGLDLGGSIDGAGGIGGLLVESIPDPNNNYALTDFLPFYDGNGNITGLVKAADGTEVARYSFGPFGEELRQSGEFAEANPFRWSTKYRDDLTGWKDYGYRWLGDGRWQSRDPIGEEGGINLYGLIGNDQVNKVDVLGLSQWNSAKGKEAVELAKKVKAGVLPTAAAPWAKEDCITFAAGAIRCGYVLSGDSATADKIGAISRPDGAKLAALLEKDGWALVVYARDSRRVRAEYSGTNRPPPGSRYVTGDAIAGTLATAINTGKLYGMTVAGALYDLEPFPISGETRTAVSVPNIPFAFLSATNDYHTGLLAGTTVYHAPPLEELAGGLAAWSGVYQATQIGYMMLAPDSQASLPTFKALLDAKKNHKAPKIFWP